MIKSLSHDRHTPAIKILLLHCIFHLINTTSYQYTPPVAWVIAIISQATCSENDQVIEYYHIRSALNVVTILRIPGILSPYIA